MTFIEKFMPRAEPLLTESDLADCDQPSKPVDTRDLLDRSADSLTKALNNQIGECTRLEKEIEERQEELRQRRVIIEGCEAAAKIMEAGKERREPVGIFPVKQRQPDMQRVAERSRDEHESARHEPEQERETA